MIFDERDPRQKEKATDATLLGASGAQSLQAMADMNSAAMQLFVDSAGGFKKAATEWRRVKHAEI